MTNYEKIKNMSIEEMADTMKWFACWNCRWLEFGERARQGDACEYCEDYRKVKRFLEREAN